MLGGMPDQNDHSGPTVLFNNAHVDFKLQK